MLPELLLRDGLESWTDGDGVVASFLWPELPVHPSKGLVSRHEDGIGPGWSVRLQGGSWEGGTLGSSSGTNH